jgi:ribosomal protein S12 methylthiotransferase
MRSTFIVGFPGERPEHVDYLEEWLGRAELDRVGFFSYSQEDGTPGGAFPNQVAAKTKRARLLRLRDAQRRASETARAKRLGRTELVLVEEKKVLRRSDPLRGALGTSSAWVGRSMGEAPGVDGGVYFTGDATPGDFVDVTLDGATAFDFHGTLVPARALARV